MKKSIFIALATISITLPVNASETRCGWINLGMVNMYLQDGEAAWIIRQPGYGRPGFFSEGMKNIPSFEDKPKIVRNPEVNNNIGYGCACLEVETDREKRRITVIYGGEVLPLSTCRNDPNLLSDPFRR